MSFAQLVGRCDLRIAAKRARFSGLLWSPRICEIFARSKIYISSLLFVRRLGATCARSRARCITQQFCRASSRASTRAVERDLRHKRFWGISQTNPCVRRRYAFLRRHRYPELAGKSHRDLGDSLLLPASFALSEDTTYCSNIFQEIMANTLLVASYSQKMEGRYSRVLPYDVVL